MTEIVPEDYPIYPAVNYDFEFPPEIRAAMAASTEIQTAIANFLAESTAFNGLEARLANLDNAAGFTNGALDLNDEAVAFAVNNGTEAHAALDSRLAIQVPPVVAAYISTDPTIVNSVATMALNSSGIISKWKPNTQYVAGQQAVADDGDIVSAKVDFVSGAVYDKANWNASVVRWDKGITTADLNTLQVSGRYSVNVTNLLNLPVAATGTLVVLWGTTTGTQEFTTRATSPVVYRRYYSGSSWGVWTDVKAGTASTPIVLTTTDVLDNLVSGYYRSPLGSTAGTLGLPVAASGSLRVLKNSTTSGLMFWEPVTTTDPSIWYRAISGATWSAWQRIDGLKALADAKTYADGKDAANRTAWAVADEVLDDKIDGIVTSWDRPGVAFAVSSKNGNPTWLQVNDTDGGPTAEALSFLAQAQTTGAVGAEKTLPPERNFTISTYDGPRKLRSDQTLLVGFGDSHMLGGAVPSTRFMSILDTMLPGTTCVNRGAGGNTTDLVAVRAGAIRPKLTFAGGAIPASGAVTVTTTDAIAYRNLGTFSVVGTVAGVEGTLARTDPYTLTFTRTTTGTVVTTGPAEFVSLDYALYSGAVQILLAGRNDIAPDVRLNDGSVPLSNAIDRCVSAHVAMVEAQTPVIKKTLILGGLTDVSYVRGTPEYQLVTGINQELQRIYPNYFWDLRGYLVNQCIYDAGMTPTAADLTAMAGDTLPPSIMLPDNTHFGVEAHAEVAEQLYAQLISRKLVNA